MALVWGRHQLYWTVFLGEMRQLHEMVQLWERHQLTLPFTGGKRSPSSNSVQVFPRGTRKGMDICWTPYVGKTSSHGRNWCGEGINKSLSAGTWFFKDSFDIRNLVNMGITSTFAGPSEKEASNTNGKSIKLKSRKYSNLNLTCYPLVRSLSSTLNINLPSSSVL